MDAQEILRQILIQIFSKNKVNTIGYHIVVPFDINHMD